MERAFASHTLPPLSGPAGTATPSTCAAGVCRPSACQPGGPSGWASGQRPLLSSLKLCKRVAAGCWTVEGSAGSRAHHRRASPVAEAANPLLPPCKA